MIGVVTGLTAEARIGRCLGVAEAGGGLPAGAEAAAERLVARGATALISFGLAGGLNPALPPGTLLVPAVVETTVRMFAVDAALTAWLGGPAHRLMAGPAIVASAAEKAALFARGGADAIDLESGAVAAVAARHGLPCGVLRAICDSAGSTLPPAALLALDAKGAIGLGRVAGSVIAAPWQLPALLRLARDAAAARRALLRQCTHVQNEPGPNR